MRGVLKTFIVLFIAITILSCATILVAQEDEPLTYKESMFAIAGENGQLIRAENPVFRRGQTIRLVVRKVGPFELGEDGKHWMDIDMRVISPTGETVLDKENLLGEEGHDVLEDNYAASPNGIFTSSVAYEPGKYTMYLTIRDVVANNKVTVRGDFELTDQLGYQDAVFVRINAQKEFSRVEDSSFQRGEEVHMVILDAGKFQIGGDGKHRFEIHMDVTGPDGSMIYSQQDLLKEGGHILLKDDIAESPYVSFKTSIELDPGTYYMNVTIRDLIAAKSLDVRRPFILK